MIATGKTLLIGIFALVAAGLLTWSIVWVRPSVGNEEQILHVRFTNIDKVLIGTRVLFAGEPVGKVTEIQEIRDARIDTIHGKVYIYQLTLAIDSHVDVYTTDHISVKTSGLMGERSIEITPMPPQPGKPFERATSEDILYASTGASVEDTFAQINKLSSKVEKVFDEVGDAFTILNSGNFWENLNTTAKSFKEIAKAADHPKEIEGTLVNIFDFSTNLKEASKKMDQAVEDLGKAAENFMDVGAMAKDLVKTVDSGQGSVGAFLKSNDFYLQLRSILAKVETLMDDINQYGLLFSSDRRWQRLRERKAACIANLCTPQSFYNYFNCQIDEITATLERVQEVVCESQEKGAPFDCCFQQIFADLLRRIGSIQEVIIKVSGEVQRGCCMSPIPPFVYNPPPVPLSKTEDPIESPTPGVS